MTNEERIPQLQSARCERYHYLKLVHDTLFDAEENAKNLRIAYEDLKAAYEAVDRELAMIDGRCTKCEEPSTRSKRERELDKQDLIAKLSEEQINELLAELGVQVPEVEEVPDPSEVGNIDEIYGED